MPKLPKITSLLFLCNILRKKWVIKLIFCMQISMKVFYKLILDNNKLHVKRSSFYMQILLWKWLLASESRIYSFMTKSSYLPSTLSWHKHVDASGYTCCYQVSSFMPESIYLNKLIPWFLMAMVKHSQSFQNSKFAISLQYLKKEVRDEDDFLHSDKHRSFLQVDFNTLRIKVS